MTPRAFPGLQLLSRQRPPCSDHHLTIGPRDVLRVPDRPRPGSQGRASRALTSQPRQPSSHGGAPRPRRAHQPSHGIRITVCTLRELRLTARQLHFLLSRRESQGLDIPSASCQRPRKCGQTTLAPPDLVRQGLGTVAKRWEPPKWVASTDEQINEMWGVRVMQCCPALKV